MTEIAPGIYFGLDERAYHSARGLSCSGMKHLTVSELNYWHRNINPDREPEEDTEARRFGKAVHCYALERERFDASFAMKLSKDDHPDALVTADDLKKFLEANGLPKSGKSKQDLIDRIVASCLPAVIWDHELERHAALHEGKTFLGKDESKRIERAAKVMADDPYVRAALTGGMPEVSFFVRDPETGVLLKARMDYVRPRSTMDIKTFSNSRGKPVEKAVFEAIYYESYYLQCVFYHQVREIARRQLAAGEIQTFGNVSEEWLKGFVETEDHGFGLVFIESAEPFDLRFILLKQAEVPGADSNVYWSTAQLRIADLTYRYAKALEKYGDAPWRELRPPHLLEDADIPQLMFS
ncbi:MAG: PD-(D/E)XK nuclease-like domain-containing protein [Planctomycetes bacterium]|nr:PD-(D/E)XK nuclease-like domain-containing protein [Planctomycetota bacterium]